MKTWKEDNYLIKFCEDIDKKNNYSLDSLPIITKREIDLISKSYGNFIEYLSSNRDEYLEYFSSTGEGEIYAFIENILAIEDGEGSFDDINVVCSFDSFEDMEEYLPKWVKAYSKPTDYTLYRGIWATSMDSIDKEDLGECFAEDLDQAIHICSLFKDSSCKGKNAYVFKVSTPSSNTNPIVNSLLSAVYGESEVRLIDPSDIKILDIKDYGDIY